MGKIVIKNIKTLAGILPEGKNILKGKEMKTVNTLSEAWLEVEGGLISDFGTGNLPGPEDQYTEVIDANKGMVMPAFADSHTHIVFAETREKEYVMRIEGRSYEEIAEAGGGILNSAKKLQSASEDDLFESALARIDSMMGMGTGAIEIKSGYGLTVEDELKMLRVIKRLKQAVNIPIKSTFLGAHAFPAEYKENQQAYVDLITQEMIPTIEKEGLAEYVDVFCDRGFFTPEQTAEIIEAGNKIGLKAKIHANELGNTGGIQVGVKYNAISVDHLEHCGPEELEALKNSNTIPTPLPGTAFFLGLEYPPARTMVDYGLPLALASDYNPGSCPSGNMQFVMALGCTMLKLLPEESFNACTINAAAAMELAEEMGSITKGKKANLIITKPNVSLSYIPYSFGENHVSRLIIG
jgi:imidazolonepropionase